MYASMSAGAWRPYHELVVHDATMMMRHVIAASKVVVVTWPQGAIQGLPRRCGRPGRERTMKRKRLPLSNSSSTRFLTTFHVLLFTSARDQTELSPRASAEGSPGGDTKKIGTKAA